MKEWDNLPPAVARPRLERLLDETVSVDELLELEEKGVFLRGSSRALARAFWSGNVPVATWLLEERGCRLLSEPSGLFHGKPVVDEYKGGRRDPFNSVNNDFNPLLSLVHANSYVTWPEGRLNRLEGETMYKSLNLVGRVGLEDVYVNRGDGKDPVSLAVYAAAEGAIDCAGFFTLYLFPDRLAVAGALNSYLDDVLPSCRDEAYSSRARRLQAVLNNSADGEKRLAHP